MLSRLATSSRCFAFRKLPSFQPALARIHSSVPVKSEEKKDETPKKSFLQEYGLDDWRVAAPIGIILGIPVIANEFYVISAETSLAAVFLLFSGAVYKYLGPTMYEGHVATKNELLKKLQDWDASQSLGLRDSIANVEEMKEILPELQKMDQELATIKPRMMEMYKLKLQHQLTEATVKALKDRLAAQNTLKSRILQELIADTNAIAFKDMSGDSGEAGKAKKVFMESAIASLSPDKSKPAAEQMNAVVSDAFKRALAQAKANYEKSLKKEVVDEATGRKMTQGQLVQEILG